MRKRANDEKMTKTGGIDVETSTNTAMRKIARVRRNTRGNASIDAMMIRMKSGGEDERENIEMTTTPVKTMIAKNENTIVDERNRRRVAEVVTTDANTRTRKRKKTKRTKIKM